MEQTFIIIKPDAIKRGLIGRIISMFEDKDFKIIDIGIKQVDREWCWEMYKHVPKNVFNNLAKFMMSAPVIGIIIEGHHAIDRVRDIIGPTNSFEALPGTIRGNFGSYPVMRNCIHASDSLVAVNNESSLFFGVDGEFT